MNAIHFIIKDNSSQRASSLKNYNYYNQQPVQYRQILMESRNMYYFIFMAVSESA